MSRIEWENLKCNEEFFHVYRCRVPGGWLVFVNAYGDSAGLTFMPDRNHVWDGGSLDPTDTELNDIDIPDTDKPHTDVDF